MNGFQINDDLLKTFEHLHYPRNEFLYWQDELFTSYYFVLSGVVKDFIILPNGEEKLFFIAEGPYMSGSERKNYGKSCYRCCCMALTEVEAVQVPAKQLDTLILQHPELGVSLIHLFNTKTTGMQNQAEESLLPVPARLAKFLLDAQGYGLLMNESKPGVVHITHLNLARFVSSTRSHVTKCLAELERQGIIRQDKQCIHVLDEPALRHIARLEQEWDLD